VGFCLGEGQEIDWIGHTEYSETRIEQLDHIFNLIGIREKRRPESIRDRKGRYLSNKKVRHCRTAICDGWLKGRYKKASLLGGFLI
ncbi:hypothetical protein, partial [Aeromonas caviae]|uniref:hypothetical protein n=1 Tax=Aeromonas caviae TaxID=648 RepID=UPI001FC87D1E